MRKTGSAVSKTGSLYGRVFAAVFMLCAAAAANLVSAQIRADRQAGSDFSYILDHMADRLVSSPLNISFEKPDIVSGLAAAAGIALIFLYKTATKKNYRDGEEEGSARWGNRKDISAFADPNPRNNLLMTKTERLSLDTHKTKRNLNALVIGSSDSGKTRSYVLPNLKNRNMNYAITDPKGEICAAAREELETAGYRVKILDLKNMNSNADKFNPLRYIDPDHSEKSIRELTENIISNTSAENAKNDQFWAAAERTLLTALISFAYYANWHDGWENETAEQTAKREPTLNDATDLLELADSSEQDENYASRADILMQEAQKTYDEARAAGFEGYDEEAKQTLEGIRFALRNYRRYSQGASETRKSIVISLGVRLSAMNIREVRELLSGDTMEIDKTDENKTAIFLTLSDTDTTFSFLAAIFYQCLFSTMIRKADSKPQQRLGRGTALLPRRIRKHRENPLIRNPHSNHPLKRNIGKHNHTKPRAAESLVRKTMGNPGRKLRLNPLPGRKRRNNNQMDIRQTGQSHHRHKNNKPDQRNKRKPDNKQRAARPRTAHRRRTGNTARQHMHIHAARNTPVHLRKNKSIRADPNQPAPKTAYSPKSIFLQIWGIDIFISKNIHPKNTIRKTQNYSTDFSHCAASITLIPSY